MSKASLAVGLDKNTPAIPFTQTRASLWLDLVRAIAALIVLFDHWRNLFFVDYNQLTVHKKLYLLPYLLAGAGHSSVIVFFVLSGYLVGGSILRMYAKHNWRWSTYLIHRLSRLWVVLIPALLLGLLWDRIGLCLPFAKALYAGHEHAVANVAVHLQPSIFFANIVFLQNSTSIPFGSNNALWSLSNEFWYYILFPLAFFAYRAYYPVKDRLLCAALFLFLVFVLRSPIVVSFPFWLCGVLLVVLPNLRVKTWQRFLVVAMFLLVFFGCVIANHNHVKYISAQWITDSFIAVATTLMFWILNSDLVAAKKGWFASTTHIVARFSYTLYLVHLPLLVLLAALCLRDGPRWTPNAVHLLLGSAIAAGVIGFAWFIALLTEFHTAEIVVRLQRIVDSSRLSARGVTAA